MNSSLDLQVSFNCLETHGHLCYWYWIPSNWFFLVLNTLINNEFLNLLPNHLLSSGEFYLEYYIHLQKLFENWNGELKRHKPLGYFVKFRLVLSWIMLIFIGIFHLNEGTSPCMLHNTPLSWVSSIPQHQVQIWGSFKTTSFHI